MKTATWRILTFSIWIGMLAGTQLLAQQTILDKSSSHSTISKTVYVAQQQESTDQSNTNPTSPQPSLSSTPTITSPQPSQNSIPQNSTPTTTTIQPSQNSTPTPAAASQTQQSDSVPGTMFPGIVPSDQNPEAMPENMAGVDNGLWDGAEPGNCCAICGGGYCSPPCWYVEQGVEIMTRSRPRDAVLGSTLMVSSTITQTGTTSYTNTSYVAEPKYSTHDAGFNIAPGYYATIGRYLGRDCMDRDDFLEFSYWGMNTWSCSSMNSTTRVTDDYTYKDYVQISQYVYTRDVYKNGEYYTPFFTNPMSDFGNGVAAATFAEPNIGAVGFDGVQNQRVTMDSEMHNWELNVRLKPRGRPDQLVLNPNGRWQRECQPGDYLSYLVGLRYMTIGDGFHLHSQGNIDVYKYYYEQDPTTGQLTRTDTVYLGTKNVYGDYNILTQNDLLGLQIGADLDFRRCKWNWGIRAKMGPYVNFARNVKELYNDPNGIPSLAAFNNRFSQRRQVASLVGEVGFDASYKFRPNFIGRAEYDFRWITGLALGSEQATWYLDPSANDTINTNGTIYSHGLTLSLEWLW